MKRVLIIDDDTQVREMLRRMLEYDGYEVMEAEDGEAGLQAAEAEPVDLVITDILMPNKEGLETIMGLRKSSPSLPIIAISGGGWNGVFGYLTAADKLGATSTLSKPFTRQEMLAAIEKAFASC